MKTFERKVLLASLLLALVLTLLLGGTLTLPLKAALFLSFFVLFFLLGRRVPYWQARYRALRIESELPIALRAIATELSIGVPFERIVDDLAAQEGPLAEEFARVKEDLDKGLSMVEALERARTRVPSSLFSRALSQLAFLYSYGYESRGISKLIDEISSEHRSRMKEFASRSSLIGVLFIGITSVVPALATVYLVVGSSFLSFHLSPTQVFLFYTLVLPLVTLGSLLFLRLISPLASKRGYEFLSPEEMMRFEEFLSRFGVRMSGWRFLALSFLLSVVLALIVFYYTQSPLSIALLLFPLVVYGLFLYSFEFALSDLERNLPEALFYAASMHELGLEKVISKIAHSSFGELSREFQRAEKQISAGLSVKRALRAVYERNRSPVVERAISLLIKIHEIGPSLEEALKSTAEDLHDMFSLFREREAVLSMQRYNLMVAALIVPAIFGSVLSLVSSLDLSYVETLLGTETSSSLLPALSLSIFIYLIEFSVIASVFLAEYSGSWKRFVVYLIFVLPVILTVFYLSQGFIR